MIISIKSARKLFMKIRRVKIVSVLLAALVLLPMTGCSGFLKKIAGKEAAERLEEELDFFYSDPFFVSSDGDETPEYTVNLDSFGTELVLAGLTDTRYVLDDPVVNDGRDKVAIDVTFTDVRVIGEIPPGTQEDISGFVEAAPVEDIELTFELRRKKDEWYVTDMSGLRDIFIAPYEDLIYIDENGMPTSFYEPFFEDITEDCAWYDPIMGNPMDSRQISTTQNLQAVFYFNRPVYLVFDAVLLKDGGVVSQTEVVVDGGTTANCEFWDGGRNFTGGSYTVELYYAGGLVDSSDVLTVR